MDLLVAAAKSLVVAVSVEAPAEIAAIAALVCRAA